MRGGAINAAKLVLHALAAAFLVLACNVSAQPYPAKPIRLIVPFAPGGGVDFIARAVSIPLSEMLGKAVIVDNRAGGGATIGTETGARSAPDGYTLLVGTSTSLSVNPVIMKVSYDAARDFTPVTTLGAQPHVFVLHPAVAAKTLRDFVALTKSRPGMFRYSSSGNGGPGHLAGELFRQATGAELVHVPYRGQAAAIISVVSGEVQLSIPSIASVLPQIRSGKLRAVAVTSEKRAAVADDIPTLAEEGYAGIESTSWTGLFAPAGLPAGIVQTLHKAVASVLRNPDVVAKMTAAGVTPGGEDPAAFAAFVRSDREKWRKVISTARIHID